MLRLRHFRALPFTRARINHNDSGSLEGLGSVAGSGSLEGLGSVAGSGSLEGLGSVAGSGCLEGLGSVACNAYGDPTLVLWAEP